MANGGPREDENAVDEGELGGGVAGGGDKKVLVYSAAPLVEIHVVVVDSGV